MGGAQARLANVNVINNTSDLQVTNWMHPGDGNRMQQAPCEQLLPCTASIVCVRIRYVYQHAALLASLHYIGI